MLRVLVLLFTLGIATNAFAVCSSIYMSPSGNPSPGQSVSFSLSGCNSACYYPCIATSATWTVSCQGSFVINGTTYNNYASISNSSLTVTFNNATNVTVSFRTSGCSGSCNGSLSKTFTVGTPPPPPITRPSSSLVDHNLINVWKTAGADKSNVPTSKKCTNVHTKGLVYRYSDGYRVRVNALNDFIKDSTGLDTTKLYVIYFQAAKYYFDKGETINLRTNNLVLSGEGATKTKFIIDNISTSLNANASTFINISGRNQVGVTCLHIKTTGAFPSSYLHERDENGHFKNKSIINISSSTNCWVSGVQVHRGYGSTVQIGGGSHNEVTNCMFYDHWTLGGRGYSGDFNYGGTQGYGVNIYGSDNNLVENNKIGLARHCIIVQGSGNENSTTESELSSGNVIAYNYLYEGLSKNWWQGIATTLHHPWNITFHGGGKNRGNLVEGNVCIDKIGIDDEKGANGIDNTLYKNIVKTQIDVEKVSNCGNANQRFVGNAVYKRSGDDRYKIKGDPHIIKGNRKCDSNGGNCNTGTFNVGDKCGFSIFNTQNKNTPLSSGQSIGQSCYLTSQPDFLTSFPYYNPETVIKSKNFYSAPAQGCYTCANVELPPIIKDPDPYPDPKDPIGIGDMKKLDADQSSSNTEVEDLAGIELAAFPNPTSDKVTIKVYGMATMNVEDVEFQLYNVVGKMVARRTVVLDTQNSFEYDLSALGTGVYVGAIITNGKSYTVKIVKQ